MRRAVKPHKNGRRWHSRILVCEGGVDPKMLDCFEQLNKDKKSIKTAIRIRKYCWATSGWMPDYRRAKTREVAKWLIIITLSIKMNKNEPFNFWVTHDEWMDARLQEGYNTRGSEVRVIMALSNDVPCLRMSLWFPGLGNEWMDGRRRRSKTREVWPMAHHNDSVQWSK